MTHHVLAIALLVLVLAAWVGVQGAWRRAFPGACSDPDVLAARRGCQGCDSADACERRHAERGLGAEEDER
jgi:hypothetical protein